jgi:hypothetical protein
VKLFDILQPVMSTAAKLLLSLILVTSCSGCALKDTSASSSQIGDGKDGGSRNMYSPEIYGDPQAQQQWIAGIEALETQCRTTGKYCQEAQGARQSLRNHTSGFTRPAR